MVIGKIDWFGGLNNKNQRNHYGYITVVENNNTAIYVNRNDVPQYLQELIEGNKGKGVYVNFYIDTEHQRAVNVELMSFIGIVDNLKQGIGYIECENHPDVYFSPSDFFNLGEIVHFGIRYNYKRNQYEAIALEKIDKNIADNKIIAQCIQSNNYNIFKNFLYQYLQTIPHENAVQLILKKLKILNEYQRIDFLNKLLQETSNIIIASSDLRSIIISYDLESYSNLINIYLKIADNSLKKELLDEVLIKIEESSNSERLTFWNKIHYLQENLEYNNFLWNIAPEKRRIPVIAEYSASLPADVAENLVMEYLKDLNKHEQDELISEIIKNAPNLMLHSSELRSYLKCTQDNSNSYGIFINQYFDNTKKTLNKELIDELINRLEQANDEQREIYWQQIKYLQQQLQYKNFLWNIAPLERKKAIIRQHFKTLIDIIYKFKNSNYPYKQYISYPWQELYELNQLDELLMQSWDKGVTYNDLTAEKMISARGAEKLVIYFYQALNYQVEDISIHQITQQSQEWKLGDIKLNAKNLLDVKNSRKSVNCNSYSEFCVAKFKEARGTNIKIVGVLSPDLKKQDIKRRVKLPSVSNPQVLGAFDKTKLTELEKIFSDKLISINMPRGSDINKYLPPWIFDYDEPFYEQQFTILQELEKLHTQDIPSWEEISSITDNFIPLFIAAKLSLPKNWIDNLPQWQVNFINFLINLPIDRMSLPYLFLSILKHFLSMLSYSGNDYSPHKYLEILYTSEVRVNPLKIYDPLNIIKDFCDTLQIIWNHRQISRLDEFKIFKFSGKGLLQGKRTESEYNPTTILAYCGGWIDKMGKCGFRPLVIGREMNCPACGRLICPARNCRCCSQNCYAYMNRKMNLDREL